MTKKERKRILILVIVAAIIVVAMIVAMSKKGKNVAENTNDQNEVNKEEFVQTLDDGTRLNTSTKLQEKKTFEGMEITNFQLTEKRKCNLTIRNNNKYIKYKKRRLPNKYKNY